MTDLPGDASPSARAGSDLLARLHQRSANAPRYADAHEIARGGMGAILEVRDLDLRRKLAMKVLRSRDAPDRALLQRFLEEAQVTAQLDHPGVVPVHELGLDEQGRVYFTMALVRGRDLEHVFGLVRRGEEGWTRPRALEVLLKVCDTMAFAHAHGVIHRDLKPANVMVGSYGEVYVMDWGLAKLGGAQPVVAPGPLERVASERSDATAAEAESSLVTLDGTIVGTPSYMSPEQARGEELDARADVYALGAMLYALCAGRSPYSSPNVALGPQQIVEAIRKGPPLKLDQLARDLAPELAAICEKAMARERPQRYEDMRSLAEDLRRYLEGRVVRAYRTGAWVEFKKWVTRNRGMAAALAGVVLALLAGAVAFSIKEAQRADASEGVLRLADGKAVRELAEREQQLWPPSPEMVPQLAAWLKQAREVHSHLAEHQRTHAALAAKALPQGAPGAAPRFETQDLGWWYETLGALIADLGGLSARIDAVEERRVFAATVRERTVDGGEARARWSAASAAIAASPRYGGLKLAPQLGLLPLAEDPHSGLWEFWHVQSGAEPQRGADGALKIERETGIVLVLLPGGSTSMGSKKFHLAGGDDPPQTYEEFLQRVRASPDFGQPWLDPRRKPDETFFAQVELAPFLLSKYELTQAQWTRLMGSNPSQHANESSGGGPLQPVDAVDWYSATSAARRLALVLPTEAQWEYAARAGSQTIYPYGSTEESLQGRVNLADRSHAEMLARMGRPTDDPMLVTLELDDGWAVVCPVGTFPPDAFGLHEMLGNVWEWCRDTYEGAGEPRAGDGLRGSGPDSDPGGTIRGGSWLTPAVNVRPSNRMSFERQSRDGDLGVRFARSIDP